VRRILFLLSLGILILTLQTTLLAALPVQRVRPDLLLILTLYLGLSCPPVLGGVLAFLMGYLVDLFSGNTFGLYTLSRPLLFYAVHFFRNRFYLEGFSFQSLFVFFFSLLEGLFILMLLAMLNPDPLPKLYPSFFTFLLPQSLFTGVITPMLLPFLAKASVLFLAKDGAGRKERG
jgi:rod shape-determining protein MreD